MTTVAIILHVLFILCLTSSVVPRSVGLVKADDKPFIAEYMVFAMMIVVAVKLFVDSIRILKGKMMYTLSSDKDIFLLTILAAVNTFLYALVSAFFVPFGLWFFPAVVVAGFLWAFFTVRIDFTPGIIKKVSFVEFAASVFMVIIAVLYLFTELMI